MRCGWGPRRPVVGALDAKEPAGQDSALRCTEGYLRLFLQLEPMGPRVEDNWGFALPRARGLADLLFLTKLLSAHPGVHH